MLIDLSSTNNYNLTIYKQHIYNVIRLMNIGIYKRNDNMTKLITILLPCLNEEKTLDKCIKLIKKTMNNSKYKKDYSLLVCDNGSTDNSINICKKNRVEYTICNNKG